MPEKGSVVLATAGRDAGGLYVVLERTEKECLLADGRKRRLDTPKRKNLRHVHLISPAAGPRSNMPRSRLG